MGVAIVAVALERDRAEPTSEVKLVNSYVNISGTFGSKKSNKSPDFCPLAQTVKDGKEVIYYGLTLQLRCLQDSIQKGWLSGLAGANSGKETKP